LTRLAPFFPRLGPSWTADAKLPGGDFPWDGAATLARDLGAQYRFLTDATAARLVRSYGTRAAAMLGDARASADLGCDFGHSLTEREVVWLVEHEWARSAEDILWRRSKLGLRLSTEQAAALGDFLSSRRNHAGW
jgi:glycerol-3-phosphate dehydrogenase